MGTRGTQAASGSATVTLKVTCSSLKGRLAFGNTPTHQILFLRCQSSDSQTCYQIKRGHWAHAVCEKQRVVPQFYAAFILLRNCGILNSQSWPWQGSSPLAPRWSSWHSVGTRARLLPSSPWPSVGKQERWLCCFIRPRLF